MMKKALMASVLATVLSTAGFAFAADEAPAQEKPGARKQERIYGSQMMTREERAEYRARMRDAKTAEEREQIRKEHHERMKERAKERGMTLPDEPPARGSGMMGPAGGGMGQGGGGMGGGRGR